MISFLSECYIQINYFLQPMVPEMHVEWAFKHNMYFSFWLHVENKTNSIFWFCSNKVHCLMHR